MKSYFLNSGNFLVASEMSKERARGVIDRQIERKNRGRGRDIDYKTLFEAATDKDVLNNSKFRFLLAPNDRK